MSGNTETTASELEGPVIYQWDTNREPENLGVNPGVWSALGEGVGEGLRALVEKERSLDKTIRQLKSELLENWHNPTRDNTESATLRILMWTLANDQPDPKKRESTQTHLNPTWTLLISGLLLESRDLSWLQRHAQHASRRFTTFIRKVEVSSCSDSFATVSWEKDPEELLEADCFQMHRSGSKEDELLVRLYLDEPPGREKSLSPALAAICGFPTGTSEEVGVAVFQYIAQHKLVKMTQVDGTDKDKDKGGKQKEKEKEKGKEMEVGAAVPAGLDGYIQCDALLSEWLKCSQCQYTDVIAALHDELQTGCPVEVAFPLQLRTEAVNTQRCYDVSIELSSDHAMRSGWQRSRSDWNKTIKQAEEIRQQVEQHQKTQDKLAQQIELRWRKYRGFKRFSEDIVGETRTVTSNVAERIGEMTGASSATQKRAKRTSGMTVAQDLTLGDVERYLIHVRKNESVQL